jgi:cytochrome c oxidase cbb3-type subunit 2
MIANARADLLAQRTADADVAGLQSRYPKVPIVAGAGDQPTEMDALVAYLQMLGTLVNFSGVTPQQLKQ